MPNEQKVIRPSTARKREPRKQELDSTPIKRSGDGTMNFMVWSIAGTVLAACGGPIFGKGTDLAGGGGGGDSGSGPSNRGYANDGPARDARFFIDVDGSGTYTAGDTDLGVTNDAGYVELDSLPRGTVVLVDANGAVDTATGKTLSGIWRSLPYNGSGDLLVSPLTNLLALRLEDTPGIEVGGEDAFYQEILDSIWGAESGVTVSDILDPDNYNPLVEDNIATQLVSRVAIGLTEIGAPANAADSAVTLTEVQALFADYSRNIADDDATNDAVVLSGNHAGDVNSLAANAKSRPVVVDPNEGDSISIREGEDFVLMRANGNPVSLFGFEDPLGNDVGGQPGGAREPGQIVGIYIEAASADGNIAVRFGDATSSVALDDSGSLSAAERGVPSDGTISADGITTIGGVTFYYVSAEYFARLVLRPTNNDFNTASVDDDNLPKIRFYVYDGEDVTVDAGGSLDRVGALAIEVANVNDAPVQANAGSLSVAEGGTETITDTLLEFTDVDNAVAELIYTITDAPMHGILQLRGDTIASGGTFTQADIDAGDVQYEHDDSENHADGFTYSVSDGEDTVTGSFSITISPVNDNDPVIRPASVTDLAINAVPGNLVGGIRMFESDDVDAGDTATWSIASRPNNEGTYGRFEVDSNTGLGTFTFLGGGASESAFDAIASGSSVVLTYMVTATDGSGGTHEVAFNIVLQGQDDAPVFDDLSEFTGNVVNSNGETGRITVSDIDGDTIVLSAPTNTDYGSLAFSRVGSTDEYEWTLNLNPAGMNALDALGDGQTSPTPIAFAITATGGTGGLAAMQTLMITLQGTNDAPTITSTGSNQTPFVDASATDHIGSASAPQMFTGTAVASDVDANDGDGANGADDFTWSIVGAATTTSGTLVFDNSGVGGGWTFTTNAAAFNTIAHGQRETITYSVQARDPQGALSAAMDLMITLEGVNDRPELAVSVTDGAVTEAGDDGDTAANGNITITDPDTGHNQFTFAGNTLQGRSGSTGDFTDAGGAVIEGIYGDLTLTTAGIWTYVLDDSDSDTQGLRAAQTAEDVFEIQLVNEDGTGQGSMQTSDTVRITIDVTGANDATTITSPASDFGPFEVVDPSRTGTDDAPTATGTFSASDPDDDITWSASATGVNSGLGTVTFVGNRWTFTLNDTGRGAINALASGDTTDITFDIAANGVDAERDLTITLRGAADTTIPAPVIGAFTGSITDDDPASDTNTPTPVSGTFSTTSGTADTWTAEPQQGATAYGTISVTGSQWTFTLNAAGITEINRLDAGETTEAVFDVTAENVGGDDTSTLTISLTGIDDNSDGPTQTAPVIPAFTGSITDADPASDTNAPNPVSGTFSTTSGTADGWMAVPRAGATEYGTIVVTGTQWTFTLNAAGITEINRLDAGGTTDAVFDVTATNVGGSAESTLTISLTGIVDNSDTPAPVIGAFTSSIVDDDSASDTNAPDPVSGTFSTTSGTADTWTAEPQQGATAYGTISVTGSQWTFTLNAAGITEINRLDAGDPPAQAVFDVTATNVGGSAESTLTISLTGIVDNSDTPAPVIAAFTGSIADADPASDTNAPNPVSGTFSTTSSTADTWVAEPQQGATAYGTIVVTGAQWTFTLNAAGITEINRLDAGGTTDAVFDVTATNAQGSAESTLTISLTGIVDNSDTPAPVIPAFTGSIADDDPASDTNAPNPVSGTFSTTSGTADGWMAVPRAGATEYGTIVVTGTQWTFTLNAAGITEINRLDAGGTTDAVFDVTATNVGGAAESTLTISLTGIVDNSDTPAPVIGAFTGSIADADPASDTNAPNPVSGTFSTTSGTADGWMAVPRAGATEYGTIVVTGTQWTFTLNAAGITEINRLDAGGTTDAVFDVTATNAGGDGTSTLTISLTGIVDNSDTPAPVIGAFTSSIVDDDSASDTNAPDPVSGTFSTTSGTADGWMAVPQQGATAYGTISVTGTQWTFTLNAAGITEINRLDAGDTTDAVFDVTATNVGGSAESTLTISLTGIVDNSDGPTQTAPVIPAFTGSITDDDPASDTNAPNPVSGTFSTTSSTADTWVAEPQQGATEYGTIVVTGAQWTFTLNAAGITEINRLDAGGTTDAVFDVTATNAQGSAESTLTISLTGIVDNSDTPAPVIAAFTGSITDDDPASDTNAPNPVSGTFSTTSGTADGWMAVPRAGATEYGTIVVTGTQWTFTLNAAGITEINRLDAGDTPAQAVFDVTATNVGGSAESTLTISLTGIVDNSDTPAPVIGAFTSSIADTDPASDTNAPNPVSGTFSTTSGTADGWMAVPRAGATAYGTIVVTGAQWTFTLNAAGITEINRLDAGDPPAQAVFDVTATNVGGSAESTLTISLTGIVDNSDTPAPVIGAFTGSITDDDPASDTNAPNPVSGTFSTTSGTADGWMAVPRAGATEYGTIVVTGTQWTFTLNAAGIAEINRLDAGDPPAHAVFDVTATNAQGSAESTLTISLTGIVDNSDTPAPVIPAFTGSIADDDPASDTNAPTPVSGTFSTTSGTADGWMAVPRAGATEYGTIVVTGTQWTFTLNAAGITEINRLDAGGTTDAVFDVTATNVGGSAESTLTISLTGIVDNSDTPAPVIAAFTGSITDDDPASDTNAPDPVSGTFSTTSGTADGWMAVPRAGATEYGTIVITGAQWTFTLNAAGISEINRLDAGDTPAQAVFDVTATNVGGSDESTLTISLTGIDDNSDTTAPVIDDFTGSIVDDDAASDTNAPNPVSGTFSTASGSGTADTWTAEPQQGATAYGTILVTGAQWTFTLNAAGIAEINRLDAGETTEAIFDVTAENVGGDDTSTLTISLTGIEDNSDTPLPVIVAGSQFNARTIADMLYVSTNEPDAISGAFTATGTVTGWSYTMTDFTGDVPAGRTAANFGSFTLMDNGQWTFDPTTGINDLNTGQSVTFEYTITADNVAGSSAPQTFTIMLQGRDNLTVTNEGGRAFVIINGVEFRASDDGATGAPNGLLINFASGGPGVIQEAGFQGRAGSYSIRAGNDFSRANIAGIWNTDSDSNDDATATIIETGAEPAGREAWQTSIAGALRTFSTGTDAPDLSVKEGIDLTASGWLQVTGGTGDITYGSTVTGTNTPDNTNDYIDTRKYTYAGTYGDLVIDGDGDWVYTLGGVASSANAAAYQRAIDGLIDTAPERFNLQINIGEQSITHDLEITVSSALGVSSEGVREHLLIYGVEFRALEAGARGAGGSIYFNNSGADDVAVMASSYAITTSIFSQANIANLWNTDTNSNGEITTQGYVATIIEEMPLINTFAKWIAMERGGAEVTDTNNGSRAFTAGTDAADLDVSEDTDLTASGWLEVTGGTGDITYGRTMTGTNTPGNTNDHIDTRKYTYAGIYGNLVIDGDGDWVYTLGGSDIQNDNLAGLISTAPGTDEFRVEISRGAERVPQTITITVNGTDAAPMLAEEANADKTATEAGHALSNSMTVVAQGTVASGGLTHTDDDAGQEGFAGGTVQIKADTEPDSAYAAGQGSNTGNNIGGTDRGTAVVGTYGIIYLRADGDWYYELADMNTAPEFAAMRAAVDALDAGDPVLDRFVVRVQDTADAALFSNLVPITIAITGTNDRPEIDTGASTTTYDSVNSRFVENVAAVPDDLVVSGMLVATDPDADDTNLTWDYQAPANLATYGTFNIVDGNWTFTLGDGTGPNVDGRGAFGMISENNPVNLDFTITATDAQGAVSVSETLRLTLEGNNRPVAGGENTGTVREAGHRIDNGMTVVDAGTPTASGSITHTDSNTAQGGAPVDDAFVGGVVQIANIVDVAVAGVSAVGDTGAYTDGSSTAGLNTKDGADRGAMLAGDYGTIYLRADGDWYYELDNNNAAVRELEAGSATLTERFSVRIQDGSVATLYSEPVPITITIDGADDAPRIIRNDVHTILYDEAGIPGGVLGATDDDKTDRGDFTWVVNAVNGHNYGVLRIDPNPSPGVFTNWTFTLNQEGFDTLPGGAAGRVDAAFSITAQDQDNLASDPVTVTIQLIGVNDAPVIDTEASTDQGRTPYDSIFSSSFVASLTDPSRANDRESDNPMATGTLVAIDPDTDAEITWTEQRRPADPNNPEADDYGLLTFDTNPNHNAMWTFTLNQRGINALNALTNPSDTLTISFYITADDGNGTSDRTSLTITLEGAPLVGNTRPVLTAADGSTIVNVEVTEAGHEVIGINFPIINDFAGTPMISAQQLTYTDDRGGGFDATTGPIGGGTLQRLTGLGPESSSNPYISYLEPAHNSAHVFSGEYGTFTINRDGTWFYTLDNDNAAVNALDGAREATNDMPARSADRIRDILRIRIQDSADPTLFSEPVVIIVNITGTNDRPEIDTSNLVSADGALRLLASITELPVDDDPNDDIFPVAASGRFIATDPDGEDVSLSRWDFLESPRDLFDYGSLDFRIDGVWEFRFNQAGITNFNALTQAKTLDFVVRAEDHQGAFSDFHNLRITLAPASAFIHTPVLSQVMSPAPDTVVRESGYSDGVATFARHDGVPDTAQDHASIPDSSERVARGRLIHMDEDIGQGNFIGGTLRLANVVDEGINTGAIYSDASQASATSLGTRVAGDYGTFYIASNGVWTYILDNTNTRVNEIADLDVLIERFSVHILDDRTFSLSNEIQISINIGGTNDRPVVTLTSSEPARITSNTDTRRTGTAEATDIDTDNSVFDWRATTTEYGSVTFDDATAVAQARWRFRLDVDAFNRLPGAGVPGHEVAATFDIIANDGSADSVAETVTIMLQGVNEFQHDISGAFEADYDGNGDVPRDLKVADLVTEDVDVGETYRYFISDGSADKDSFAIRNDDELWILEGAPGRAQGDTWDVRVVSSSREFRTFLSRPGGVTRVGDTIDPPELTILSDGGLTVIEDGYQDNGLTSIIGSFSHTDADIGEGGFRGLKKIEIRTQSDSLSYDFNTGDAGPNQEIQLHGDYGRLIIAVGGNLITEWSYILGDGPELNALDGARAATDDMPARAADMVVEQFLVRIEDHRSGENGGPSIQASDTFMITIRGTNDSPVIDTRASTTHYDNSNARFEASVDAITSIVDPTVMGRFTATDLDAEDGDDDDDFTWAGTQVADTPEELTTEQGYGMLSFDDVGNWDFTFNEVGAAAFSNLLIGEQINLDFMITATDRQGAPSEARILRITLNGQRPANNANNPTLATPAISLFVVEDSTTMRFIVDEMLGFGDTEDADADLIIVASLEPAGLDVPAAPAATSELLHLSSNSRQRIEGTYGDFILTRDNDTGQIEWTYVINDERKATNALSHYRDGATDEVNANALGTEMLSLRVWDSGGGASDIRAINVQIRGANDKPEISQVSITNTPSDNTPGDMDNPSIIPVEPNPSGVINFLTIDAQSVVDSIIAGNPITGTFSASDPDAGASQTWSATNTLPDLGSGLDFSSYGSFVVNPAGEWTFSMEAFQASQYARLSPRLPSNDPAGQAPLGQYVYDFTIGVTDADSATGIGPAEAMTDEQIFRITFVGAEDAPQTPTFNDSSNNQLITTASAPDASGDRSVSGSLVVREPDRTGSIDWSSSVLVDNPVYAGIERLGTLSFVDTGQDDIVVFLPPSTSIFLTHETARWTFTLSEDDFRSYGTTQETLIFDIIATDDTGLSSEALQLTIMVQGEEDPYTISPDSLSAIINEKMTTGQIEAIEHDIDDLINGAFNFEVIDAANSHGTFSITDAATGAWEFTFNEASMDALTLLREGAQLRPFTVSVRVIQTIDGVSSPAITENLRLTIQGTNDVPTLTALDGTMAITADITESTGDNVTANAMTGGMLMNVDPDAEQSAFDFAGNTLQAAHGISTSNTFRDRQIDGTYGMLRLNNVTGAWTYELDDSNDSAADRLAGGATQTDTFTIRMENVDGPSTVISNEVTLTINITGANDAPKIDNNTFAAQEIRAHPADGFIEGTFSAADRDMGDSLTWSVLGRDAVEANFGTFEFTDAATGAWRFTFNPAAFGNASSRGTGISTRIQVRDREQVNDALTDEQVFLLTLFGGGAVPIINVGSNTSFDNPDNESDTGNQHVITALFGNSLIRVIGNANSIGDGDDLNDVLVGVFTATDADDSNFTWTASNPRVEGVSVQDSSFILDFLMIESRPSAGAIVNGRWSYNFDDTDSDIIELFDSLAGAHSRGGSISKPAGEVTLIFDITAEDDNDNISPTQELKITLRGVNDNPSLDGIEENPAVSIRQGVLTSTIFEGGTYEITGNFRATDPDVERITYSVSSNGDDSRPNGIRDENNRIIGTLQDYGDIDFGVPSDLSHSNPNVWRFVLNGHGIRTLNALGANEEVSTVYGVAATDGINATGSSIGDQGIKITLRGAGSDPLPDDSDPFTGFVTDPDAINSNDDPTTRPGSGGERIPVLLTEASGTFSLTNIFAWRASNANTATSGGPTVAEKNGWSTLTFDHQLINHNGWTFALTEAGERALANLAPGETEVLRYRISLFDSFDGEADQNYTYEVTLRGHAVPELSEPGQALYHVVEGSAPTVSINNRLTFRDAGDSNSALVIVASLNQADIDVDTAPASNRIFGIQTLNGVYGDFRLVRRNGDGAIEWTYTLDNNRVEPLGSNDTPEEMFYIRVWDPNNSSSEIRTINVQVQGVTRQVPVLDAPPADASYHVVEDNDPEPDTISAKLGFSDAETSSANLIIAASTGDLNGVPAPSADQTMVAGTYGDFTVERSIFIDVDEITWTYTIDEARASALLEYREDNGEAVAGTFATETLYLRVWDNNDQRSSVIQTINVQVRGANDAPTDIHATPDGTTQAVADNAVVADYDEIRTPLQPLLIAVLDTTDDDTGDVHTYTISAVDTSQGAVADAASFEIRGTNNDELWLIADDTIGTGKAPGETWSITITATDSSDAVHEDTFTIIHVTDVLPPMIDNPNLTGSLRDRFSKDHTNLPETTELTGMFTSSDNRITWTVMGDPEISGSNLRGLMPDHFGAFSFDDPMNSGAWTFTPTAGINSLHNNQVAVVTYRVVATSRDTGFVSNATLEITFTGTNDTPILSSYGTPDFGVTEDDPSDTAGGRIITEDPDIGQAITPTGNPFPPGIRRSIVDDNAFVFVGNQIRGYGADGNRVSGSDTANGGKGTQIEGDYGYLYLKNDGTWTYELDDNFDATDDLTSDDSASGGIDNRATDHFQIEVANRDEGRDGFSERLDIMIRITGAGLEEGLQIVNDETAPSSEGYYHVLATGGLKGTIVTRDTQTGMDSMEDQTLTNYRVALTEAGLSSGSPTTIADDIGSITAAGTFAIGDDGIWTYTINKVLTDTSIFTDGTATRSFWVAADETGSDPQTVVRQVSVTLNQVDLVRLPADSITGGATNQLIIGSGSADGSGASPLNTAGGTDVIIGLEGDDGFRLGRNDSDTIYHRFASSGADRVNTDGNDTFTNYVRGGTVDDDINNPDTFIFVDTAASAVTENQFIGNDKIEFFADVAVNSGVITITGFEIRFLNSDNTVESTISIDYNSGLQPVITSGIGQDFGLTEVTTAGTHKVTAQATWGHYFGDNDDAFQVVDDDDLPSVIMAEIM